MKRGINNKKLISHLNTSNVKLQYIIQQAGYMQTLDLNTSNVKLQFDKADTDGTLLKFKYIKC